MAVIGEDENYDAWLNARKQPPLYVRLFQKNKMMYRVMTQQGSEKVSRLKGRINP